VEFAEEPIDDSKSADRRAEFAVSDLVRCGLAVVGRDVIGWRECAYSSAEASDGDDCSAQKRAG
jgi:hypothetical protein